MYFCLEMATESGQTWQYESWNIPESENSNLEVKNVKIRKFERSEV